MVKAVIFDLDGVIIDSEGTYLSFLMEFAVKKNPKVCIEQLYPTVGASKQETWTVVERVVNNGQSWEQLREEYRKRNIYDEIDYKKLYRPEVTEVLQALKEKGYLLALASSTRLGLAERILRENEIRQYFEEVVSGSQFKRSKPDPQIYRHTASRLGLGEKDCLAVEDSTIGITAAYKAGMKVAALIDDRYQFDQSLADYYITRVKEVLEVAKEA